MPRRKHRTGEELVAGRDRFPRWLIAIGLIGGALLAYVGARGGPDAALQEVSEAFGYVRPPHIVSLQPAAGEHTTFIVSIENPRLRPVQVTGYEAVPAIQMAALIEPAAGAGSLPVMKAEESHTAPCQQSKRVSLSIPLVIEPKASGGLEVTPWVDECDFSIRIEATSGISRKAYWSPRTEAMLREMQRTDKQIFEVLFKSASPDFQEHLRHRGLAP